MMDITIQNCIYQIKDGEICKEAAVTELLDVYYRKYDDNIDNAGDSYPEELTLPLEKRKSGICESAFSALGMERNVLIVIYILIIQLY